MGSFGGPAGAGAENAPIHQVPHHPGQNLFQVAAAGMFLFRERIGPYGVTGISAGVLSFVPLSVVDLFEQSTSEVQTLFELTYL